MPDSTKCTLNDPDTKQCCCNCVSRKPTFEHCTTNFNLRLQIEKKTGDQFCICGIQTGWACCLELGETRIYPNWPEHSCGCECYRAKCISVPEGVNK